MIFFILLAGFCIGYIWCRVWRLGRPQKVSLAALIVGYLLGRKSDDRTPGPRL